jgi:hypothetical protein
LKRDTHDDEPRAIATEGLRSRIDEGLTSLDQGNGADGEQFMEGMLRDLDSLKAL